MYYTNNKLAGVFYKGNVSVSYYEVYLRLR